MRLLKGRFLRAPKNKPIELEEIFFDSYFSSQESGYEHEKKIEVPIENKVFWGTKFFVAGLPMVLLGYLVFLQVARGEEYKNLAADNVERVFPLSAPRGDIFDKRGEILATSTNVFDLELLLTDFDGGEEDLAHIAEAVAKVTNSSPASVIEKVINAKKRNFARVLLALRLEPQALALIQDVLKEYDALVLREQKVPLYPNGALTAHITGYVGNASVEDIKKYPELRAADLIGKDGLELAYDDVLRGKEGSIITLVNAQNNVLGEKIVKNSEKGTALYTEIDLALQKIAFEELQRHLAGLGLKSGGVLALDPRSGALRALVSLPSFDPNIFRSSISGKTYAELVKNKAKPFFNRITSGAYATGSVIKPLIASAALEANIIAPNKVIYTHGALTVPSKYDPDISYTFLDWKNHGAVDMRRAIAVSSNVYFYTIGGGYGDQAGLGIDRIKEYLKFFGWGSKLGVDLPSEAAGLIPDPNWKASVKNEEWYIGDTYNTSIGQGDILATPLQVGSAVAAIANGGSLYTPYVVKKTGALKERSTKTAVPISEETLRIVREGMRQAVLEGSSQQLQDLPFKVAGKTGTAQTGQGNNNAWFAGFAPYENPSLVLVVLLEGGESSTEAVLIARDILQRFTSFME